VEKFLKKRSKKGKIFFGCSKYPECDFVSWSEPLKDPCPECGSYMVLKFSKTKGNYAQCSNSECKNKVILENEITNNEK
jgi:DNA topoisomerase-1